MKLSTNFSLSEFLVSQTAERFGIDMTPTELVMNNLQRLVSSCLQPLRDETGPIFISSGFRPFELNSKIGGSTTSAHVLGNAADLIVTKQTPFSTCELMVALELPFDQVIHEFGRWTHIGIGANLMGWFSKVFGGNATAAVSGIAAVGNVMDNLFTSKDEKLTHQEIRMRLAQAPDMAQIELNKVEAQHRSMFVAGWRPAIGWVCGLGLFNMFMINPWLQWFTDKAGPNLPEDVIMELIFALLGLGTLRTIEKIQGRAK